MKFRPDIKSLHRAWIAGCFFAGLLLLIGGAGWVFRVGFSRGTLIGYGVSAVLVLAFSRGLYHRSIVSGGVLLLMGLGPIAQLLLVALGPIPEGTLQWPAQWTPVAAKLGQSFSTFMKWTVALSGLGLSILTVRGMYDLSSEEAPSTS